MPASPDLPRSPAYHAPYCRRRCLRTTHPFLHPHPYLPMPQIHFCQFSRKGGNEKVQALLLRHFDPETATWLMNEMAENREKALAMSKAYSYQGGSPAGSSPLRPPGPATGPPLPEPSWTLVPWRLQPLGACPWPNPFLLPTVLPFFLSSNCPRLRRPQTWRPWRTAPATHRSRWPRSGGARAAAPRGTTTWARPACCPPWKESRSCCCRTCKP